MYPDGSCVWYREFRISVSHCVIDITWFPFDSQVCDLIYESKNYDSSELNVTRMSALAGLDGYSSNGEWELIGKTSTSHSHSNIILHYRFCSCPWAEFCLEVCGGGLDQALKAPRWVGCGRGFPCPPSHSPSPLHERGPTTGRRSSPSPRRGRGLDSGCVPSAENVSLLTPTTTTTTTNIGVTLLDSDHAECHYLLSKRDILVDTWCILTCKFWICIYFAVQCTGCCKVTKCIYL